MTRNRSAVPAAVDLPCHKKTAPGGAVEFKAYTREMNLKIARCATLWFKSHSCDAS
jgi:hypothetical protein